MSDPDGAAVPDPRRPNPSPSRRTLFPRLIVLLLLAALAGVGMQALWGQDDRLSWAFLGAGAACAAIALASWRYLSRVRLEPGRPPGILAWIAFPALVFGWLAMLPLLLLAVYPESRAWLDPQSTITARHRQGALEIVFPRSVDDRSINLTFDDTAIPAEYFDRFPDQGEWRDLSAPDDSRVLRLDLDALRAAFTFESPRRLGINANRETRQIFYQSGERVSQQWIVLPREP